LSSSISFFPLAVDLTGRGTELYLKQDDAACNAKRPSKRTGKPCCELSLLLFAYQSFQSCDLFLL